MHRQGDKHRFDEAQPGQPRIAAAVPNTPTRWRARLLATAVALGLAPACAEPDKGDTGSSPGADASPLDRDGSEVGGDDASDNAGWGDPCGQAARDAAPTESLFEPAWLPNVPLDSVAGVLTLFASTLRDGPNGLELYAGVCNDGEVPLCGAAIQIEFYDQADQLVGTASAAVQSGRLYSFSQSPTPISCVAPGQTAMAALTALPEGLVLDELQYMGHRFPAFQIDDAALLPGVTVSDLQATDTADGSAFSGVVTNSSDTVITDPVVWVFTVNHVGRPLGFATSAAILEIPPGGSWSFETNVVAERGAYQLAFASGTLASNP